MQAAEAGSEIRTPGHCTKCGADLGGAPLENLIAEFHQRINAGEPAPLGQGTPHGYQDLIGKALVGAGENLVGLAKMLKALHATTNDRRVSRAELMVEELGETLLAMSGFDEIETLDGLADLLYVTVGTARLFDLPVEAAYREVHRSNMTKNATLNHSAGVSGKGHNYSPPDIAGVLAYRRRQG